ncbi:MAG: hypothetical protein A2284_05890 [Deltaproteobacteria bacterium RIFOXYA12_FULL_61_11]|nr:MAG: hypothetical protein A2284_05890 [Deltaproteobacteria bacterium RIFOXYA12_FULL_61_11]
MGKTLLFAVCTFGVLLEVLSLAFVSWFDYRIGLAVPDIHQPFSSFFVADRQLGWDTPGLVRSSEKLVPGKHSWASSYGDSFVYSSEVQESMSWQNQFQRLTGQEILNFGVCGYGTDQALLKLEKLYTRFPTPVVFFGLLPDNALRNVSVFKMFYFRQDGDPYLKPRFMLHEGHLVLYRPPVGSASDYSLLHDIEVARSIAARDYWYQHMLEVFGFDLLTGRGFPYSLESIEILLGAIRRSRRAGEVGPLLLDETSEVRRILFLVLERFLGFARRKQFTPVIILNCARIDLGTPYLHVLSDFLRANEVPSIDMCRMLSREVTDGTSTMDMLYHGEHYSERSYGVLARAVAALLGDRSLEVRWGGGEQAGPDP